MDGDLDKLTVALSALLDGSHLTEGVCNPLLEGACNQNSEKSGTEGWSLLHVAAEEVRAAVCNALVDQMVVAEKRTDV